MFVYRWRLVFDFSYFEYMDIKSYGLFSGITTYFVDLYLDNGFVLFGIKRKNNQKENRWSYIDFDRGSLCVFLKLCECEKSKLLNLMAMKNELSENAYIYC